MKREDLEKEKGPYVIYTGKGEEMKKILDKVSFAFDHVSFYHVEDDEVNKLAVVNSKNVEVLYEGEEEKDKVQSWILDHTLPYVVPLSSHELVSKILV